MTTETLRALTRAHGALAWVSVAALAIAVAAAWRRRSGRAVLVPVAAALALATFVTGAMLHAPFQIKLRQRLFLASLSLGWLFERKEHAAFGALAFSICGAIALWASKPALPLLDSTARDLRRAGVIALTAALALELFALAVSIAAGRRVGF